MKHGRNNKIQALLRRFGKKAMAAVLFAVVSFSVSAQTRVSTYGTEFWTVFMSNYKEPRGYNYLELSLSVAAKRACTVTLEHYNALGLVDWSDSFNVSADSVVKYVVSDSIAYVINASNIGVYQNIKITSTDTIAVYSANYLSASMDVANLLPIQTLGTEYVLQTYPPRMPSNYTPYYSECAVTATENSTTITLIPSVDVIYDTVRPAGVPLVKVLNKGQTLFITSAHMGSAGDLSGTRILSSNCKKIAVFQGNELTFVPNDTNGAGDIVFSQAMPVSTWGREFVVTNTIYDVGMSRSADVIRVTASQNNTVVKKNGIPIDTIAAYHSCEFRMNGTEKSAFVETSNPSSVYMYLVGMEYGNNSALGDPSMMWIPPVSQSSDSLLFDPILPVDPIKQLDYGAPIFYYVNVVAKTTDTAKIFIDSTRIVGWDTVTGNGKYSYVRDTLYPNLHYIHGSNVIAHLYGLGNVVSYACFLGTKPYIDMYVDSISIRDSNVRHDFNAGCEINFASEVKFDHDSVVWDFGDGTRRVRGDTVNYAYRRADTSFTVTMLVYSSSYCQYFVDTLKFAPINIDTLRDTIYPVICAGATLDTNGYMGYLPVSGRNYAPYYLQGIYTQYLVDTSSGCLHNLVIDLTVSDTLRGTVRRTICSSGSTTVNDSVYTTAGTYRQKLKTPQGCDSILTVVITVADTIRHTINQTICAGSTFTLNGHSYTDRGSYRQHLHTAAGCDSILHINITVSDTLRGTVRRTICSSGSTTINDSVYTTAGTYRQKLRTPGGCDSILTVVITVADTIRTTINQTICAGSTFTLNGHSYTDRGSYRQHLHTAAGCDSILHINITVSDTLRGIVRRTICTSGSTTINDSVYTAAGTYRQKLKTPQGCDSILTVVITVADTIRHTINQTICAGSTFTLNGHPYTIQGNYRQHLHTAAGCDSILHINLKVNDTLRDTIHPVICAGARFDTNGHLGCSPVSGQNYGPYYNQGVYTQHLRAPDSCFRNLVIDLTVNDTLRDTIQPVICAGNHFDTNGHLGCVPVNGVDYPPYYTRGVYTQYLRDTTTGCYRNLVISLTVNDTLRDTIHRTICAGGNFDTLGQTYSERGVSTYQYRGQDGCFHNLVVFLYVNDTLRDTIRDTICAGANFDTNGHLGCLPVSGVDYPPYYDRGVYTQHLRDTITGCYRNLVIILTVSDTLRDTIRDTICAGAKFDTNGHLGCVPVNGADYPPYYDDGVYKQYLRDTSTGCYRNLVVFLTVNDTLRDTVRRTLNAGGRFDTNNITYRTAGTYTQYLRNPDSCHHNLVIIIRVLDTLRDTIRPVICAGQEFDTNRNLGYGPYTATGVYTQRLRKADSSFYNLVIVLTVNDTFRTSRTDTVCRGTAFTYNGLLNYISTNPLLYDTVITYRHSSAKGCDSTVLINLHINDTIRTHRYDTICAGEVFSYQGVDHTVSEDFVFRHNNVLGCDSNVVVHLFVKDTFRHNRYDSVCAGHAFLYADTAFYTTGPHLYVHTARNGCDSNVVVNLWVKDTFRTLRYDTICRGDTFTYDGRINYCPSDSALYDTVIVYLHQTVLGCDSNVVIQLHIKDTSRTERYDTICSGKVFRYEGIDHSVTEDFVYRHQTVLGCDSNVVVHLYVRDTFADTLYRIICKGDSFDTLGQSYTRTNIYRYTYFTPDSCLNNLIVNLNVLDTTHIRIDSIMCAGSVFRYGDSSYYLQGNYFQVVRNPSNCDLVTINLTVSDTLRDTIHPVICAGASFDTNGHLGFRPVNGQNYPPYTVQGFYTQYLRAPDSCFHNLVIDLTVSDTLRDTIHPVICAGASFDTNGHLGCSPVNGQNYQPYTVQGVYTQYLRAPDSCFHNLVIDLTVNDTLRDTIHPVICAGDYFDTNGHLGCATVNGQNYPSYTVQGVYTQYLRDTVTNCYRNLVIDLTVNDTFRLPLHPRICIGDTFYNNNKPYYNTGFYLDSLHTIHGCDSIIEIDLVVFDTVRDTVRRTLCAGTTYDTLGYRFYLDSVYHLDIPDTSPCGKHYLTVFLTVVDTLRDTIWDTICAGAALDTNGHLGCSPVSGQNYPPYYFAGVYTQYLRSPQGCFQNLVIVLTVNDTLCDTIHPVICAGFPFDTNGHAGCSPVSGQNYPPYFQQGFYKQYLRSPEGCFHNLVIDLTVNDTLRDTIDRVVCAGVSFDTNGYSYYQQGQYIQNLRQPDSCFNNLVINITVQDTLRDTIYANICAGAPFDTNGHLGCVPVSGQNYPPYFQPGVYTQYLRSPEGCYFDLVIDITVNDTIRDTIRDTICAGFPFDTNGHLGCSPVSGQNYPPYFLPGVYTQYLRTLDSCYLNLVIELTVNDTLRDTIDRTVCAGVSFDTNGYRYYQPGQYTQYLRQPDSCFNDLVINITVRDTIRDTIRTTLCAGAPFDTNGHLGCTPVSGQNYPPYFLPGVYTQHLRSPDSCYFNLVIDITVNDTIRDTIDRTVCAGVSFDTNGYRYYQPGQYTQHLRQPDSCFNNLVINIHVLDTVRDTIYRTVCAGASFDTNGQQYYMPGTYTQHLRQPDSCYNNLVIFLHVLDTIRDTIYPEICAGETFDTNGVYYSNRGVYTQHLRDPITRCFNNLVIVLTVHDTFRDHIYDTVCAGMPTSHNGIFYYMPGTHLQHYYTVHGCDSIVAIHLYVLDTIRDTVHREVCAGGYFDTNGVHYYFQGYYTQYLRDSVPGCFHNLVIHLTVRDTIRTHVYDTVCEGETYRFNSVYYTNTGVYRYMMRTREGCDSITYLHLQVNPVTIVRVYDTCYTGIYAYADTFYTQPGVYRHLFQREGTGCDSMVYLHLWFCDSILTKVYDTICNDSTYRFGNDILTQSGVYYRVVPARNRCDSIIELHLKVVEYPTVEIVDSGGYCQRGIATLKLITDGNDITWTSFPPDNSLLGQEHNRTIYVSPDRYTLYTVTVDSVPRTRSCQATASIALQKASWVKAAFKRDPKETEMSSLQTMFTDISLGDVTYREWLFHETSPMATDKRYEYDSIVWFTPLFESDSFRVRLAVRNDIGCTDTAVEIYPILKAELWVPNAFTPDENLNTVFKVGALNIAEYEIYIYNRAGLLVFHSTDPYESWDGTYKGEPCIPASYVYIINYKTKTHPKQPQKKVGSVLLIR